MRTKKTRFKEHDKFDHRTKAYRKVERNQRQAQEAEREAKLYSGDRHAWRLGLEY